MNEREPEIFPRPQEILVVFCSTFRCRPVSRVRSLREALVYRFAGHVFPEDSGRAAGLNNNVF